MPSENPQRAVSGVQGFENLAGAQAISKANVENNEDILLPEADINRTEEEKNADVVPEDFESFNLDAVDKLKDSKKEESAE